MNYHQVVGVVGKGQGMEIADEVDLAKASGFRDGVAGGGGCRFVTNHQAGLTGHASLGRDQGRDVRVIESDLQRAFAEAHAAHGDRQRLAANTRFPQKPSHFPHDIVADCDSTN